MQTRVIIEGKIRILRFTGQPTTLPVYDVGTFDINSAKAAGLVQSAENDCIAYSKWSGPKRTRTYPFARIYDTYSHSGKVITVIPIIKDEGRGERENDTNMDRVNYITYSWMNLMNIYIVLAWYAEATKKSETRVTNQRFDSRYVFQKMQEIREYKLDAHHWNHEHFRKDFILIYEQAVNAYRSLSARLGVSMHPEDSHKDFLNKVRDTQEPTRLDIERFREVTLRGSYLSAQHETVIRHRLEKLPDAGVKALFRLTNYLGGVYYLTADEVYFPQPNTVVIREYKHTTSSRLPAASDVKDGLFKLLLFSRLEDTHIGNNRISTRVELFLTSIRLHGRLSIPTNPEYVKRYALACGLSSRDLSFLHWLNEESRRINVPVIVGEPGNSHE
jgi:hypothetical protein